MIPTLIAAMLIAVAPSQVRVVDGDTIAVQICDEVICTEQRIRLAGIDAPETSWNRGRHPPECERAAGMAATLALRQMIDQSLFIVISWDRVGRYGRPIATVRADGTNVNDWLLEEGLARPYVPGQLGGWC